MKLSKHQIKALLDVAAFDRGPVHFEDTNLNGVVSATFTPSDEADAMRGPQTWLIRRDGKTFDLSA